VAEVEVVERTSGEIRAGVGKALNQTKERVGIITAGDIKGRAIGVGCERSGEIVIFVPGDASLAENVEVLGQVAKRLARLGINNFDTTVCNRNTRGSVATNTRGCDSRGRRQRRSSFIPSNTIEEASLPA
jgi:hypothetical protein